MQYGLGADGGGAGGSALTEAISAAMVGLYTEFYDHDRTTATTYVNDKIVVFVPENFLHNRRGTSWSPMAAGGRLSTVASRFGQRPKMSSPRLSNG